jgi:kinetochore protein Spc25
MSSAAAASAFEPPSSLLSSSQNRQTMGAGATTTPPGDYSLPSTDFGFDDLRDRMAKFTAKFDAFIEQGRKRVLEERNQFRINIAELQGMCRHPAAMGSTMLGLT